MLVLLLLASWTTTPAAHAGVLWGGLGYPIAYAYTPFAYYAAPTVVYQPYAYYFGGFGYYGYARDYSYFYNYSPFWVYPWVWGFWDPPSSPQLTDTIQYAEIFTGLDSASNVIPLDGISVTNSTVFSNVDNHAIPGTIIDGSAADILAAIDPSIHDRVADLLSPYISDPNAHFSAALYDVEIRDVASAAPEPGTVAMLAGGGLLVLLGRWRKRRLSRHGPAV